MEHKSFIINSTKVTGGKFFSTLIDQMMKIEDEAYRYMCLTIFVQLIRSTRVLPTLVYKDIDLVDFLLQFFLHSEEEKCKVLYLEAILLFKSISKASSKIESHLTKNNFYQHIYNLVVISYFLFISLFFIIIIYVFFFFFNIFIILF